MSTEDTKENIMKRVQNVLDHMTEFLCNYLPLANAHNCDIILNDTWESSVPIHIQKELLALNKKELCLLSNGNLFDGRYPKENTSKNTQLMSSSSMLHNSVTTGGGSSQHDIKHSGSHSKWLEASEKIDSSDKTRVVFDYSTKPKWKHSTLESFVLEAQQYTLSNLNVVNELNSILTKLNFQNEDIPFPNSFMSPKKSHEVSKISGVCKALANFFQTEMVVDIGSGRGYLGNYLALQYKLKVLGIDSLAVNTESAQKRSCNVEKHWDGLLANSHEKATGIATKFSKKERRHQRRTERKIKNTTIPKEVHSTRRLTSNKLLLGPEKPEINTNSKEPSMFVPLTLFVDRNTNISDLLSKRFHTEDASKVFKEFIMTGLHTCGNLGPSMLRLFVENENATALCNVGCCYNLLDEEFVRGPYEEGDEGIDFSFPLSKFLRRKKMQLGRNARLLAVQPTQRMAQNDVEVSNTYFKRALLQIILFHMTGEKRNDWRVGKMDSKEMSFLEYARKAMNRLKIDDTILTDEEFHSYEQQYESYKDIIPAFFHLKMVLAPVIESLIILDRFCFLLEQECVSEVYLVQLFDAVVSPRCFGLVALKIKK